MLFKLRLLRKSFEYEGDHLVPSPKELAGHIISALTSGAWKSKVYDKADTIKRLTNYLVNTVPVFSIPAHTIKDGCVEMEDNAIYVKYKSVLPAFMRELIELSLPVAFALYGQPCVVELVKEDECEVFTHFSAVDGVEVEGAADYNLSYQSVDELVKPQPLVSKPQRLTFSVSPAVDTTTTLSFINSLHRRLIRLCPHSHQTLGSFGNDITSDEESLFFRLVDENTVTIECPTGITQCLVDAVSTPFTGTFGDEKIDYTFTLTSNEFYEEKRGHHFRTSVPSFLNFRLKEDKDIIDQSFTAFFRSLNFQFNGPTAHEAVIDRVGDWARSEVEGVGEVLCRLIPCDSPFDSRRGGRGIKNEFAYSLEIITQEPTVLRGVGTSRRFGAGVLEVVG